MPSLGRKLLMAGRGGLNLTHSEPLDALLGRYGRRAPGSSRRSARFPPDALIAWCHGLGQPTFVGSSGRVFPTAMKASPLLRAWLARLAAARRQPSRPRHRWTAGSGAGTARSTRRPGPGALAPAATVLALGGASWPRLGSDGALDRGPAAAFDMRAAPPGQLRLRGRRGPSICECTLRRHSR